MLPISIELGADPTNQPDSEKRHEYDGSSLDLAICLRKRRECKIVFFHSFSMNVSVCALANLTANTHPIRLPYFSTLHSV
jgi:hypothetical protein